MNIAIELPFRRTAVAPFVEICVSDDFNDAIGPEVRVRCRTPRSRRALVEGVQQRIAVAVGVRPPAVRPLVERHIDDELRRGFERTAVPTQQHREGARAGEERACGCT